MFKQFQCKPRLCSRSLIPLLLALATVGVYWPILRHQFVGVDDGTTIFENERLQRLAPADLCSFWTSPQSGLYAPLTYSLFAAIALVARKPAASIGADDIPFHAWPFHAVSLLLHVLTVLVVYQLLRRLVGRRWPAAAGALLFSLHPVQVETVAWATEINGLLCGFLSLWAVLLYMRSIGGLPAGRFPGGICPDPGRDQLKWFVLATGIFILAMLAKTLGVIVPVLAAILFWMVRRSNVHSLLPRRSMRTQWELALWLVLATPMALIARLAQPIPPGWVVVPYWLRPLVAADALAFYVYKLLVPITLIPDYDRSPRQIESLGWSYCTWVVPATLGVLLWWLWRRRRADAFVAARSFVVALLPVLGLMTFAFQRMSTVADRYLYLPMFGVSLCAAWALDRTLPADEKSSGARRYLMPGVIALTVIVLAALGVRTALQTRYWRDTTALFEHTRGEIGRDPGVRIP